MYILFRHCKVMLWCRMLLMFGLSVFEWCFLSREIEHRLSVCSACLINSSVPYAGIAEKQQVCNISGTYMLISCAFVTFMRSLIY